MPYIGQDWRSPGDAWFRTQDGSWEQIKLRRPSRNSCDSGISFDGRIRTDSECSSSDMLIFALDDEYGTNNEQSRAGDSPETDMTDVPVSPSASSCYVPQPHCFVKTGKSREFVGCASMGEAFCKLQLCELVGDVRKFNYICKVVEILVKERLEGLSGSARKMVLALMEAIVLHSLEASREISTSRQLVVDFLERLSSGRSHCGSPKMLSSHVDSASNLHAMLAPDKFETPADCLEDGVTFLDLPVEVLRAVLRRLPDHTSLLTAAEAADQLARLVGLEHTYWETLCRFHFQGWMIQKMEEKLKQQRLRAALREANPPQIRDINWSPDEITVIEPENDDPDGPGNEPGEPENQPELNPQPEQPKLPQWDNYTKWRSLYFECKKFFGLREVYADMLHICCHCKALFWMDLGHPCVHDDFTSVRVTPRQFIQMLCNT